MTAPMEPTLIVADIELQEGAIDDERALTIPRLVRSIPPQGDRAALAEAARLLVEASAPLIVAERAARNQQGVDRLVELAEALGAPVIDLGARMNFPNRHGLCHSDRRSALMREADVVLLLEVADSWGQLHSVGDPHKDLREIAKPGVKTISVSMADVYVRSNYQDFQRFQPIDLAITGDVEASLPVLTELVKSASSTERTRAFGERAQKLAEQKQKDLAQAREDAALAWDASPITTARLAMELWPAIRNEPWSLAVSDRIPWARRLWPTTRFEQMLGGSGGQGVGYGAPGAVGVALANKAKGLLTVTFQPDGDLLYAPGALWTAAHHRIPLLFVMHNNRAYHQETMHLQQWRPCTTGGRIRRGSGPPSSTPASISQSSRRASASGPKDRSPILQRSAPRSCGRWPSSRAARRRWSTSSASRVSDAPDHVGSRPPLRRADNMFRRGGSRRMLVAQWLRGSPRRGAGALGRAAAQARPRAAPA